MKEEALKLLGRYIKANRQKSGFSQRELGFQLEHSQAWVHAIESGQYSPSYQDIIKLCLITGADEKVCMNLIPKTTYENLDVLTKEIKDFQKKMAA